MATTVEHIDSRPDLDVEVSSDERWKQLEVSAQTDLVAALVAAMYAEADLFVDRAVRRIQTTLGVYEQGDIVERDDLWWSVYRNLETVLLALGEQRPLSDEELAVRRELGRRRAQQGMAIDEVMRAFRIGYTTLWEGLSELAARQGPEHAQALLDRAANVWMTFDQVTSAVAAAHREIVDTRHLDRRRRGLALLAGLQRHPQEADRTEQIARSLGLDPSGPFTVAVHAAADRSPPVERDMIVVEQPDRFVVIAATSGDAMRAEANLAGHLRRGRFHHIGVGITRRGLEGAQQSLVDAEWAHRLAVALETPAVLYRESWLACLALRHHEQLDLLVAPAVQALERDEELSMTLEAYLEADGNLTSAGKALFVHPNTVGYRLKQFAQRSGIDPRGAAGMALIQVALTYARLGGKVTDLEVGHDPQPIVLA